MQLPMEKKFSKHNFMPFALILACLILGTGCTIGEGVVSERLPSGLVIPIEELPREVMNADDRLRLLDGTIIQKCNEGKLYRFDYPDGTIWMKSSEGNDIGGVI